MISFIKFNKSPWCHSSGLLFSVNVSSVISWMELSLSLLTSATMVFCLTNGYATELRISLFTTYGWNLDSGDYTIYTSFEEDLMSSSSSSTLPSLMLSTSNTPVFFLVSNLGLKSTFDRILYLSSVLIFLSIILLLFVSKFPMDFLFSVRRD